MDHSAHAGASAGGGAASSNEEAQAPAPAPVLSNEAHAAGGGAQGGAGAQGGGPAPSASWGGPAPTTVSHYTARARQATGSTLTSRGRGLRVRRCATCGAGRKSKLRHTSCDSRVVGALLPAPSATVRPCPQATATPPCVWEARLRRRWTATCPRRRQPRGSHCPLRRRHRPSPPAPPAQGPGCPRRGCTVLAQATWRRRRRTTTAWRP